MNVPVVLIKLSCFVPGLDTDWVQSRREMIVDRVAAVSGDDVAGVGCGVVSGILVAH